MCTMSTSEPVPTQIRALGIWSESILLEVSCLHLPGPPPWAHKTFSLRLLCSMRSLYGNLLNPVCWACLRSMSLKPESNRSLASGQNCKSSATPAFLMTCKQGVKPTGRLQIEAWPILCRSCCCVSRLWDVCSNFRASTRGCWWRAQSSNATAPN